MPVAAFTCLALVLAATPPPQVYLVGSSSRPGADAFTSKVMSAVEDTLTALGVQNVVPAAKALELIKARGLKPPSSCEGKIACLRQLAGALGTDAVVVGVDVTKIMKSLAIHADAVDASGEPVATLDLATPIDGWLRELSSPLELFSAILTKNLADRSTPPPPVVEVAPVEPPKPVVAPAAPRVAVAPASPEPSMAPWLLAGGAVAAAGGALTFFLSSNVALSRYSASLETIGGHTGTNLSLGEAQRVQSATNLRADLSIACLSAAVALAAFAIVLFAQR